MSRAVYEQNLIPVAAVLAVSLYNSVKRGFPVQSRPRRSACNLARVVLATCC